MACGCSGSGNWAAEGLVPATQIQDDSYFWQPDAQPSDDAPPVVDGGTASWSAATGTVRKPEA